MPPCFIPPLEIFMPPLIMPPPNFEIFMPPFFMPPWILLCFKEKFEIQEGISTFLRYFSYSPPFFYATSFYATLGKIKIFMPPSKSLCHPFMPPRGWHKKKGMEIKEKPMGLSCNERQTSVDVRVYELPFQIVLKTM